MNIGANGIGIILILVGFGFQILTLIVSSLKPDTTIDIRTHESAKLLIIGGIAIIILSLILDSLNF
jgi:hypothetical protein